MAELLLALALMLAGGQPAPVAPPPPTARNPAVSLAWLEGRWRGPGTTMGEADEAVLEVRPARRGAFTELVYRAGRFEGRALYRRVEVGRWTATWSDNRGVTFAIEASADGQSLTADWTGATERGRTVYYLDPEGRLRVYDMVRSADGRWREFARHVLTRAD